MNNHHTISAHFAQQRRVVAISAHYSRFVGVMKFLLPATAAAIAAMVVAWPYLNVRDQEFRLSFVDVGVDDNNDFYMNNARYFSSDQRDQPYTVTADSAIQEVDNSDVVRFTAPKADIMLRDGIWLALTAERGTLVRSTQQLELRGLVNVFSDEGYEFRTKRAMIDLESKAASGVDPVEGQGPIGLINATGFRIEDQGRTLRFLSDVRMTIYPRSGR